MEIDAVDTAPAKVDADVLAFAAGRFYADAVMVVIATEQYAATAFDDLGPGTDLEQRLDDLPVRPWPRLAHQRHRRADEPVVLPTDQPMTKRSHR